MIRRIVSAAIAIPIAVAILLYNNLLLYCVAAAMLSAMAVYELLFAAEYLKNKVITAISLIFVPTLPFLLCVDIFREHMVIICGGFILLLMGILLFMHEKVRFEQISVVAFISIAIPLSFTSIPLIAMRYGKHAIFCLFFVLLVTWMGDAGAYFIGTFFGKHKMVPKISPKKSWEGFFGGILISGLSAWLVGKAYETYGPQLLGVEPFEVNIPYIIIVGLICSVLGVLGDLCASIVKRQCMVKDFGNIMPGHGGVLDRFDSILLAVPFVYSMFSYISPLDVQIILTRLEVGI
ncbi:MAG: phosphatidate cytidylyltransferase [Oscillospiraceae bacterium]|nr:phosphatidate cytidylyltransferase [Oscillospiraceae bacterium]